MRRSLRHGCGLEPVWRVVCREYRFAIGKLGDELVAGSIRVVVKTGLFGGWCHFDRILGTAMISAFLVRPSHIVAPLKNARTAKMVELGNVLPRPIATWKKRCQFAGRMVSHAGLDCDAVRSSFAGDVARSLSARDETLVLMMDQSQVNDLNEVLMVSLGFGSQALPPAWPCRSSADGRRATLFCP